LHPWLDDKKGMRSVNRGNTNKPRTDCCNCMRMSIGEVAIHVTGGSADAMCHLAGATLSTHVDAR